MNKQKIAFHSANIIGGFFLILTLNTIVAPKAAANTYPSDEHAAISSSFKNNQGQVDWGYNSPKKYNCIVSQSGQDAGACNTGIDAKEITYKLFASGSKPVGTNLRVLDGCKDWHSTTIYKKTSNASTSKPNKGARMIRAEVSQTNSNGSPGARRGAAVSNSIDYSADGSDTLPSSSCSGNDLIVPVDADAFTTNQSGRYGSGVYTATVIIYKSGGYLGEKWLKLQYSAGEVYGDDYRYFSVGSPIRHASGNSDYNFKFQPDCTYKSGQDVLIKITDMDGGAWGTGTNLTVRDNTTGAEVYNAIADGKYGFTSFTYKIPSSLINKGHDYTIKYSNIADNNGLKINLPYSEYKRTKACPPAPQGVYCSIDVIGDPRIPDPSGVVAGSQFNVNATITNNSSGNLYTTTNTGQNYTDSQGYHGNPAPYGNYLSTTLKLNPWDPPDGVTSAPPATDIGPVRVWGNYVIAPGQSRTRTLTFTAPNDQGSRLIEMYPDYWGLGPVGNWCNATVTSYQRYDFSASANTKINDPESPNQANFTTGIQKEGVADIYSASTRGFYKKRGGAATPIAGYNGSVSSNPDTRTFGSASYPDVYGIPPGSYDLGDSWCTSIYMPYGHGWVSSIAIYNEGPVSASDCGPGGTPKVVDRPYIRTYGADVAAGGGFGPDCSATSTRSRILSFLRPINEQLPPNAADPRGERSNKSGAGSQLASMALGNISGFTSASTRSNAPLAPRGLTFAHRQADVVDNTINKPLLGGNMDGDGWCVPDFFTNTQFPDESTKKDRTGYTTNADINAKGLVKEGQTLRKPNGGKLNLVSSAPLNNQDRHTVYVDGNVSIKNNVVYSTNYSGGIQNIASFTLVVRGNIYIDASVSQLDGLYIAQPKEGDPNTGRIYTCAMADAPVTAPAAVYNNCGATSNRQLKVNGAFIAQRVVLNRVSNSIGDSTFREGANTSKAAEVFNFNPEIYLSPPVFRPGGTATSGDYDYISILAPIL